MTVEEDEAGRLAAFRAKFGRSWDATATTTSSSTTTSETSSSPVDKETGAKETQAEKEAAEAAVAQAEADLQEEEDNLLDLISSFGQEEQDQQSGKKKK